jgi:beta-glucosidase-like glycosyl hydrolase
MPGPYNSKNYPNPERDRFCQNLLAKMTLEEKVGQMVQGDFRWDQDMKQLTRQGRIGSLLTVRNVADFNEFQRIALEESRLGIPLIAGNDVIHGYQTIYPIPLALSCTWNTDLVEQIARESIREALAHGTTWNFSPMVDIARDPRWGRVAEGAGEDPVLGCAVSQAWVHGYQSYRDEQGRGAAACVKHFAAYGQPEGGKDYNTVDMSERRLREEYLPPYKAAIDAGVMTVMTSFNDLNGIPASANTFLMQQILRQEWDFDGVLISDFDAIGELIHHRIAANHREAAVLAIKAGVDIDMMGNAYHFHLADLVCEGVIEENLLDQSVLRILKLKYDLGIFDSPYFDIPRSPSTVEGSSLYTYTTEHLVLAEQAAEQSMVLLKNDGILPILRSPSLPNISSPRAIEGSSMTSISSPSNVEGPSLTSISSPSKVEGPSLTSFSSPSSVERPSLNSISSPSNVEGPSLPDFRSPSNVEGPSLTSTRSPSLSRGWAGSKSNHEGTNKLDKEITIALIGPFVDEQECLLGCWKFNGQAADTETLQDALRKSLPENCTLLIEKGCQIEGGDIDYEAVMQVANQADLIILALGEDFMMSGEAHSRADITLPGKQQELVDLISATEKPLVSLLFAGRPLVIPELDAASNALLMVWHSGTKTAQAVCNILLGKTNPSGRLTMSFPLHIGQIPVYYAHKSTGRPVEATGVIQFNQVHRSNYIDLSTYPLYPFGYGLSYTQFVYSNLQVTPEIIPMNGSVEISVSIGNQGQMTGTETVQLYIQDCFASITRPVKELKQWKKVSLEPGQSQTVTFTLSTSELSFLDLDLKPIVEPGNFKVWVGPNAAEGLQGAFSIK